MKTDILKEISYMLQIGKAIRMTELIEQALSEGYRAIHILEKGILDGMTEIGDKFRRDQVFVPEVLVAARTTIIGMDVLAPHLVEGEHPSKKRTVVIGTIQGDLHDIGKNLLKILLVAKGFGVIDLGTNVDVKSFYAAAKQENSLCVCISALLTTTMMTMRDVIEDFVKKGDRDKFKIIVGGSPVTEEFAKTIGADAYFENAVLASDYIEELYYELYPDERI